MHPGAASCIPFVAPRVALLSVRAVAAHLGVSSATIYKLVAAGELEHIRVSSTIRVPEPALVAFLARREGRKP